MEIDLLRHFNEKDLNKSEDEKDKDFKVTKKKTKKLSERALQYQKKSKEIKRKKARQILKKWKEKIDNGNLVLKRERRRIQKSSKKELYNRAKRLVKKHLRDLSKNSQHSGKKYINELFFLIIKLQTYDLLKK